MLYYYIYNFSYNLFHINPYAVLHLLLQQAWIVWNLPFTDFAAEAKLLKDSINILLDKTKLKDKDIDLIISGDLQNQIASSDYAIRDFDIPFLGIYNACATMAEAMITGATFIDGNKIKNFSSK